MANTVAELVFIPAPVVGHIMSSVEMAKLLVNRDQRLSITVLVIKPPPILGSGSAITTYIESLANKSIDRISFIELPQDETPPSRDPKSPLTSFDEFINRHCKYVRKAVADMMSQPGSARVSGFVIDMFCTGMIDVANEFNVPTYVFFTSNAAFLGFQLYLLSLCDDQNRDVIELVSNSDDSIPVLSFIKPVPITVLPASMVKTKEGLDSNMKLVRKLRKAKGIMVNTFLELETHAIKSLVADSSVPFVYPVGPLLNLEGAGKPLDDDVKRWLDGQPPSSVVFLCFGSMGSFEEGQVKEIAYALERSGHSFVWSLRRPPSETTIGNPSDYEDPRVVLPEGFMERTAGIGKVIGWAPQVALLAHRAIGGFVSHCGWNSMLESLWFGVPIAAWPMYAEQQMNAFEMVVELGLGVEIKMDYMKDLFNPKADIEMVTVDEIEGGIRRLMADDTIRTRAKEMSDKSRTAVAEGGSSYASVGCLIQDFMANIS